MGELVFGEFGASFDPHPAQLHRVPIIHTLKDDSHVLHIPDHQLAVGGRAGQESAVLGKLKLQNGESDIVEDFHGLEIPSIRDNDHSRVVGVLGKPNLATGDIPAGRVDSNGRNGRSVLGVELLLS